MFCNIIQIGDFYMVKDNFSHIRRYLLGVGFNQVGIRGIDYQFAFTENSVFDVNLERCCITAQYPDFKYNRANPLSPKTTVVTEEFSKDDDYTVVIQEIEDNITIL